MLFLCNQMKQVGSRRFQAGTPDFQSKCIHVHLLLKTWTQVSL